MLEISFQLQPAELFSANTDFFSHVSLCTFTLWLIQYPIQFLCQGLCRILLIALPSPFTKHFSISIQWGSSKGSVCSARSQTTPPPALFGRVSPWAGKFYQFLSVFLSRYNFESGEKMTEANPFPYPKFCRSNGSRARRQCGGSCSFTRLLCRIPSPPHMKL